MAKIVIIGNSAAGFSACAHLVKQSQNEVTIISKESGPAYRRDRLLDYFATKITKEEFFLCNADFYKQDNLKFLPFSEVVKVDSRKNRVILKDNAKINYDYLIIASGKKQEIPDLPGKNKNGIFGFYTLEDIQKINERLVISDTVCIIGQTKFALQIAEVLQAKNKEIKMIACNKPEGFIQTEKIEFIDNAQPQEFIGEGQLQALKLSNGKVVGTNLVIFTSNYLPSTNFLKDTEVKLQDNYILVDDTLHTNLENIFACGDVCKSQLNMLQDKSWEIITEEGILAAGEILKSIERGKLLCQNC